MSKEKRIVVAGGGFGGVRAVLELVKNSIFHITLINNTPYHHFHADLYEVATAFLDRESKRDFQRLEGTVIIPLHEIFRGKGVDLVIDRITEVNLNKKQVNLADGKSLTYDFLILALGSTTSYFDIPGASAYSHPLKTADDALNIRNDLEEIILRKDGVARVVIAGGGFTGVELAASLRLFLHKRAEITVVEADQELLPGMPDWVRRKTLERLQSLGVQVLTSHSIKKVEGGLVVTSNEVVSFDYLIWTAGIAGESLAEIYGVSLNKHNKIEVSEDLTVPGFPEVFVVGDLAECFDQKRGCPVPAAAWVAVAQAKVAAANIKAETLGKARTTFISPEPAFIIPLGEKFALSNMGGLKVVGLPAWVLKKLTALNYFASILPLPRALSLWLRGARVYTRDNE